MSINNNQIVLETDVQHDEYTAIAEKMFDIPLEDRMRTTIINNIRPPEEWSIGAIYGPSGAGKTTLLRTFGEIYTHDWGDPRRKCRDSFSGRPFLSTVMVQTISHTFKRRAI